MNICLQKVIKYAVVILVLFFSGSLLAEPLGTMHLSSIQLMGQHDKTTKLRSELIEKVHQLKTQKESQTQLLAKTIKNASNPLILIDAIAKGSPEILLNDLMALGLQSTAIHGRIISGQLPLEALDQLDSLSSLNEINPAHMVTSQSQGSVVTQGDQSQKSDIVRQNFPVDGSGVTIGVISDSYDCLGGATADKQSEDLPERALLIEEALDCTGMTDEGRALMQIIHDVAPGAHLLFHSGANGLANSANAILALAFKHKVNIIVDDKKSLSANFFQEDVLSQAVDRVVKAGVVYVTAAGNSGRNSYQSPYSEYIDTAFALNAHDFDPGSDVDIHQRIAVPEGLGFLLLLQWDSPAYSISGAPGAQTDLDIFIFNETHTEVLASSAFGNIGRDPVEVLSFFNPEGSGQNQFVSSPYSRVKRNCSKNSINKIVVYQLFKFSPVMFYPGIWRGYINLIL